MKKKYKIISIIMVIINLLSIINISKASITNEELVIQASWVGDTPYSYPDEGRNTVVRIDNHGAPVYSKIKDNGNTYFEASEFEEYENEMIKNILKHGYGINPHTNFGDLTDTEAFLATQEAIYIILENRDIDQYVIHEPRGKVILDTTREIILKARQEPKEDVTISAQNNEWIEYEENTKYKYIIFTIQTINNIAGEIKTIEAGNYQVLDPDTGVKKTQFYNGDKFKMIMPKNLNCVFPVTFSYEKNDILMYTCNKNGKDYIIAEEGTKSYEDMASIGTGPSTKIEIINEDIDTKAPIEGSDFNIMYYDDTKAVFTDITDEQGKAITWVDEGKYYLVQRQVADGYILNKSLIEMEVQNNQPMKIVVRNSKINNEEINNSNKEINVTEENKNITETNIEDISNIKTTNINKEIINQTNETNFDNVNNFINTINRKNIINLQKENTYRNYIDEPDVIQNEILQGEDVTLHMTREDYINYIDMIMIDSAKVPILPVASK